MVLRVIVLSSRNNVIFDLFMRICEFRNGGASVSHGHISSRFDELSESLKARTKFPSLDFISVMCNTDYEESHNSL